jgi:hypothetical protein
MVKRKAVSHDEQPDRHPLGVLLKSNGWEEGAQAFRDLVEEVFCERYPTATVEWVLRRPTAHAAPFCEAVWAKTRNRQIPEDLITGTLENIRKSGRLSLRDREAG